MSAKNVVVYSLPTWPECKRTKEYLSEKGFSYIDQDVSEGKQKLMEVFKKSGQLSVPVILVDDSMLVGFNKSELDKLLSV